MRKIANTLILAAIFLILFLGLYYANNILNHLSKENQVEVAVIFVPLPPPPPKPPPGTNG